MTPIFAELTVGDDTYTIHGFQPPDARGGESFLMLTREGIEGWYGTPDGKVSMTERGQGDGAHDVAEMDVQYAARTVTLHCAAFAQTRGGQLDQLVSVLTAAHRIIRLRVRDEQDTYVQGYATVNVAAEFHWRKIPFDITVICPRPERISHTPHELQLVADDIAVSGSGLSYGPGVATWWTGEPNNSPSVLQAPSLAGTTGLRYPPTYRMYEDVDNINAGYLTNNGSSRAYPVFDVYGPFEDGVALEFPDLNLLLATDLGLGYERLVLDCRSRTASIGGKDVSYALTSRGFPVIPPRTSTSVVLTTLGKGYVNCRVRDTYM
ncbi:hypothetical protein BAAM0483_01345 [Bifidobacterium animalis subsp. animalis MCC 0483]|uniref:Phage tail protein n=1 Tax=Bifidobacterium animalis subsp. animalis MCC 0483 TaxID=1365955 RepID=A0AB34TAW4_9BIFI|nr:hypothetical protein [Bifidobacterium animalis]KOA51644.1 hypothetical protein BAAM0483_01345 [Bifidobacterium animalis subsp. animalis MCC 0483]